MHRSFDFAIKELTKKHHITDSSEFKDIVQILLTHRIWTMGMGKAGLVARKLASTLACNGRPAAFIHAGEALHGDFGSIQCGDALIAFSNSGKTNEIIQVLSKAKDSGATTVMITGCSGVKNSDITLSYGQVSEACLLGLTPTTSVILMFAIVDAMAIDVQRIMELTYEQYARNHHAGYLGQIARERSNRA